MQKFGENEKINVNGGTYKLIDPFGSCNCNKFDAKFLNDSLGNAYSKDELNVMKNECQFCKHLKNIKGEKNMPFTYCDLNN